jgi:hypothetical protein
MMRPSSGVRLVLSLLILCAPRWARAQSPPAPNVSSVLLTSALSPVKAGNGTVVMLPNIFSESAVATSLTNDANFGTVITTPGNYAVANTLGAVSSALNASIATALSVVPLASPASGVIFKTDAATGVELPVSSTLGPVFVERAETIGKNKVYIGITHQDFHFTSLDGQSLNSLQGLYPGGDSSNISLSPGSDAFKTAPATFNIGMDVRLAQDTAFITYGATNRFDISVGLPMVHSSVAARTFNGQIYSGLGAPTGATPQANCWCVNTFTPGAATLTLADIGQSSLSKTGFGDMLLRFKGTVLEQQNLAVALGTDLRLPTGDEQNFLGTGATSIKPFMAISLYSKPLRSGIVFAPHFNIGWQYSGKSSLGGQLQPTLQTSGASTGYLSTPFTTSKDFLPDVFSWAAGTEVAFGHKNTLVVDILGDEIGLVHGVPTLRTQTVSGSNIYSPIAPYSQTGASGLVGAGRTSFGQYYGAFGWKAKIVGNFIATVSFLVRFDENGLTAKVVPLYGVGYSF